MTKLRKDTIALLESMPEDKLFYVFQILNGIQGLCGHDDMKEREAAFNRLENMRKKADIDYETELAEYRDERYGYAGLS